MINSGSGELRIGHQLSLEKANLDLLNTRTQLTIGFILVAILSAINFSSLLANGYFSCDSGWLNRLADLTSQPDPLKNGMGQTLGPPVTAATLLLDWYVWQRNAAGYFMTSFAITLVCSLFLALICLELTGRYGNRLKAVPAIWACLLFNLCPPVARQLAFVPSGREYALNGLFALLAIFGFSRLILLKEKAYGLLCAIGVLLLVANGVLGEFALPNQARVMLLSRECQALIFPLDLPAKEQFLPILLAVAYFLLAVLFLVRLKGSKARPWTPLACIICLVGLIYLAQPVANQPTIIAALFYAAIPFSCCLSFLAFSPADGSKLSHTRVTSVIGLIALSTLALTWLCILRTGP